MRRVVVGVVASALALGGCGDDEPVTLVEGVTVEVIAADNEFVPEEIAVAAGTEIRFVNQGRNDHNVIPVDDDHDELTVDTADLPPDATAVRRLVEPGTYDYYCSIHGTEKAGMIGTITVTEGDP